MVNGEPEDENSEGWRMKRAAQAKSREIAASGKYPPDHAFLFPKEQAQKSKVVWPDLDGPNLPYMDLPPDVRE